MQHTVLNSVSLVEEGKVEDAGAEKLLELNEVAGFTL